MRQAHQVPWTDSYNQIVLSSKTRWKLKRAFTGAFFIFCGAFFWVLVILSIRAGRFGWNGRETVYAEENPTFFWSVLSVFMFLGTGAMIAGILWMRRRSLRKGNWGPIHF